jgi:hypothetical protein
MKANEMIDIHVGDPTPWGRADNVYKLGVGIYFASTSSHGGMHLSPDWNAKIPSYMRNRMGWYEEDCSAAIPPFVLGESAFTDEYSKKMITSGNAAETVKAWYPDEWERFTGKTLQPGECRKRDEEVFLREHKEDFICISAYGSWHSGVPEGFTGICATVGGSSCPHSIRKYFLVPEVEYKNKSTFHFVVDLARHREIGALL